MITKAYLQKWIITGLLSALFTNPLHAGYIENSANNFEIELRYEVLEPSQIPSFVTALNLLHRERDVDVYLDNPNALLLYQKGIFIRVRNGKKLDIKFNRACLERPDLAVQDYCEEYNFALPLEDQALDGLNALLISLDLQPVPIADFDLLKSLNNFDTHYIVDKNRAPTSAAHLRFASMRWPILVHFLKLN